MCASLKGLHLLFKTQSDVVQIYRDLLPPETLKAQLLHLTDLSWALGINIPCIKLFSFKVVTNSSLESNSFLAPSNQDPFVILPYITNPYAISKIFWSWILSIMGRRVEHGKAIEEERGEERALRTQRAFLCFAFRTKEQPHPLCPSCS